MSRRTFGNDAPATTNEFRLGTGLSNSLPRVGPLIISEILYQPGVPNDALEFVELRNVSGATVPLFDPANPADSWRLRGGIDFDFPPGANIPPGGYLVLVSFDPRSDFAASATFQKAYGAGAILAGPYSGKFKDSGDNIELQKPDAPQTLPGPDFGLVPYIVVDQVDYASVPPWPGSANGTGQSIQKMDFLLYGNDPVNWVAAAPNPGSAATTAGDKDNDGLPDAWELTYGLNPNDPADAASDSDGDGLSNLQEFAAATNPRNAGSVLKGGIRADSGGKLVLEFATAASRSYTIEFRDSLAAGSWQKFAEIPAALTDQVLQLPINANEAARFFRIVLSQ